MTIHPSLSIVFALGVLGGLSACNSHLPASEECAKPMKISDGTCVELGEGVGPLGYELFLRGGFNGWGSDNPYVYKGNDRYEVVLRAPPGNHEFKMAPKDWKEEWVIVGNGNQPAQPGQEYSLARGGAGSFLFVRRTAYFLFTLDFSDRSKPTLMISPTSGPETETANPHKHHKVQQEKIYTTWDGQSETVRFSMSNADQQLRRYAQSTTQALRDPDPQYRLYDEKEGYPRVRSGSLAFDALFALALDEMRLDSVDNIRDGNYNNGDSLPCECFETGAKWHYVWTRDLAYAADLGLAVFDPQRVVNSLEFKLSGYRDGVSRANAVPGDDSGYQIVQDTGTGGSWPISTDRMTWSFGAAKALQNLPSEDSKAFAQKAYRALTNTIEIDRAAAFDETDGLYLGEQSFLDWREQTYASWVVDDIASLGGSKSLSTNVGHYNALKLAAQLARSSGDSVNAVKYQAWSEALKKAINERLWLPDVGLYSSLTAPYFDDAPLYKFDWLGLSLAVISGVADGERAKLALQNYPHGPMGAPVIFPQQPDIPVYHNRAIWPFVTAYGLKAATVVGNSRVANAAYDTLIRGASLNLSNMENLEWLSGQPLLLDEDNPQLSGPVINSKRQLWSVGGYLGMVVDSLFGVKTSMTGVRFEPFVTASIRAEQFSKSQSINLHDLTLRGRNLDIEILLPELRASEGFYEVKEVLLNGKALEGEAAWDALQTDNTVVVRLGAIVSDNHTLTAVTGNPYSTDDPAIFAPIEPRIVKSATANGKTQISIAKHPMDGKVDYQLYRNGEAVGERAADVDLVDHGNGGDACYSVEAVYKVSGTRSHHSAATCLAEPVEINIGDDRLISNLLLDVEGDGRTGEYLADWGAANDRLELTRLDITSSGKYAIQMKYHNAYNQINLGITNGVKWVNVRDENNALVASGILQMPHAKVVNGQRPWVYSTPLMVNLPKGQYRLVFEDFTNMSYLDANVTFTGNGGVMGPSNRFDLSGIKVTRLSDTD